MPLLRLQPHLTVVKKIGKLAQEPGFKDALAVRVLRQVEALHSTKTGLGRFQAT